MNNKMIHITVFLLGVAVSSILTWRYTKKKYEKIAEEEINSVKEVFAKRKPAVVDSIREKADKAKDKPDVTEYATIIQKQGYGEKENKDHSAEKNPYIISPEAFGEFDNYEKISLTYYADQVLADDNDELLEDVEGTVGFEALTHFGEYEEDSVFVRNDRRKCDYEILMDQRTYSEIMSYRSH